MVRQKRRGFTLIELLVVVSIIAILSAGGASMFTNAQRRGRDARRRTDLEAIQQAAEQYYVQNGVYPTTNAQLDDFLSLNAVPADPRSPNPAYLWPTRTTTAYRVCTDLEIDAAGTVDASWDGADQEACKGNLQ